MKGEKKYVCKLNIHLDLQSAEKKSSLNMSVGFFGNKHGNMLVHWNFLTLNT